MRIALVTVVVASLGVVVTGDLQARLMTQQQPMKGARKYQRCSFSSGAPR